MKRSSERILTTHTGSLPRPSDLAEMLVDVDSGHAPSADVLAARIFSAVKVVVERQVAAGIDVVNDGEQGKTGYSTYVAQRLTGFDGPREPAARADLDWVDFPEAAKRRPPVAGSRPRCNGPIEWKDQGAYLRDIAVLASARGEYPHIEAFMTAASPGVIAHFFDNDYYPTREAYIERLSEVMKEEYDAIHKAGLLLQIDCPDLAMTRHSRFRDLSTQDFLRVAAASVEALNHAVRDIPADRMRLHVCWGNYEGPHHLDIPLRDLLQTILKAKPQAISLPGANPRHEHEWAVFQDVKLPDDKILLPGVIDSTTNFIEHPELIAQRIVRYASVVGRERVIAGSDCGFGTFARTSNAIEPEITWKKLEALSEGARIASDILWKWENSLF